MFLFHFIMVWQAFSALFNLLELRKVGSLSFCSLPFSILSRYIFEFVFEFCEPQKLGNNLADAFRLKSQGRPYDDEATGLVSDTVG